MTQIGISGTQWLIDGSITYPGAAAEGLLMSNSVNQYQPFEFNGATADPETYARLADLARPT